MGNIYYVIVHIHFGGFIIYIDTLKVKKNYTGRQKYIQNAENEQA